jgi:hypothetical protein
MRLDPIYTVVTTIGPDGPIEWRVRRADPRFAAQSALLLASIGVIVGQAETEPERLAREVRAAAELQAALQAESVAFDQLAAAHELGQGDEAMAPLELRLRQARTSTERARRALRPRVQLSERTMDEVLARQQQLVIASVRAARLSGTQEWEPITFVAGEADDDPPAGRLWIGRLDDETFAALLAAAWRPAQEAAERLARFRGAQQPGGAPGAVADGAALREATQ